MGVLRTYLALCVVAGHANASCAPWTLGGMQAVQVFFIISGFYMQFVLSGKYQTKSAFYQSRALRIFIPYYLVFGAILVLSLLSGGVTGQWLALEPYAEEPFERNDPAGVVFAAATNFTIFGQSLTHFLSGAPGGFLRFLNVPHDAPPLWIYVLIPQAWTIALELMFYVLAPFLAARRTRVLVGILLLSLAARVGAYWQLGLAVDPWTYRFFPFELALFLIGMLACRFYFWRKTSPRVQPPYLLTVAGLLALVTGMALATRELADVWGWAWASGPIYAVAPFGIAYLFAWTSRSALDRFIGELSYPIYLIHYFFVQVFAAHGFPVWVPPSLTGEMIMGLSLLAAVLMTTYLLEPFERWRQRIIASRNHPAHA